jgi:hypothetical protein
MKLFDVMLNKTSKERYQSLNDEASVIAMNGMMYFEYYQKKLIYWNLQLMEEDDHQENEVWFEYENFWIMEGEKILQKDGIYERLQQIYSSQEEILLEKVIENISFKMEFDYRNSELLIDLWQENLFEEENAFYIDNVTWKELLNLKPIIKVDETWVEINKKKKYKSYNWNRLIKSKISS